MVFIKERKKIIIKVFVICLVIVVFYGFFVEPYRVKLKIVKIKNTSFAKSLKDLKVVFISDLHIGERLNLTTKRVISIIDNIKPDIIFLGGDYVKWNGTIAAYNSVFDFMAHLKPKIGVYAVTGDADFSITKKSCEFCHEKDSSLSPTKHNVNFLRNAQVNIKKNGVQFSILGLELDYDNVAGMKLVGNLDASIPTIILAHSSFVYQKVKNNRNVLVLSGDTHGGQIVLPGFIWRLFKYKPDPIHMHGLFRDKKKYLYVTSGIGTSGLPFRFGVPPEVVLFEFLE